MKFVLAIAAMVSAPIVGVPMTAAADDPPPTSVPGIPGPGVNVPAPAPAEPVPTTRAPGDTAPKTDPAYDDFSNPDVRDFPAPKGKDVIIVAYPERTKTNMIVLGGLAVGGVVAGAIGLYFHLDSRSAAEQVSGHGFTGEIWNTEKQDARDRAHSSSVTAGVFYGIGGGLLLATAIAYIVTEPEAETMVIHPHSDPKPTALIAPIKGGAVVGGAWRF
jgi:hypothetical protein